MSFFAQSPRFQEGVCRNGFFSQSPAHKASPSPSSYNVSHYNTIGERTRAPPNVNTSVNLSTGSVPGTPQTPRTPRTPRTPQGNNSLLSHATTSLRSPPSSSFGTSTRSNPLRGDNVREGLFVNGAKKSSPHAGDIGPGSYQDAHYRGSPTTVASEMLHTSHNIRIKAAGGVLGVTIPHTTSPRKPPPPSPPPSKKPFISKLSTPSWTAPKSAHRPTPISPTTLFMRDHPRDMYSLNMAQLTKGYVETAPQ